MGFPLWAYHCAYPCDTWRLTIGWGGEPAPGCAIYSPLPLFHRLTLVIFTTSALSFSVLSFHGILFAMAPRKLNPASTTGPDPGRIDDDTTGFLGASLVDDDELAKLVSSSAVVEGQEFAPGKAVVPKPGDNRKLVFAVFFEAGLRFPCSMVLPEILRLFQVELPQLSPSALVRIAIFD